MTTKLSVMIVLGCSMLWSTQGWAELVFLNNSNASVALGASMDAEPFANRSTADSLASMMDLPTADATEFHNQSTHVWVSGGMLEVDFDLGVEYDLTSFHLWNYVTETYDVDRVDLRFLNASATQVGDFSVINPAFGNTQGSEAFPIVGETIAIGDPKNVRFVNAVFSGTNNQVDFNNVGFTGQLSAVPEPGTVAMLAAVTGLFFTARRRRSIRTSLTANQASV
ncbi:hypothetical protein Enr13x_50140 [Stieleria neptunia]|uniref:Ice-binding protein C-terminal domain-containing protein n=1 Tax=Stieleria neptunia TaxID=2527979 RepID=A0A518HWA7_9BACT|nr:PEP-CTERM sorting domain-containing protein [Stieleria neptunia]QDV45140.1 hypothetical protein Enr13x_50140 [Stieleria neptunia]